MPVWIRLRRAQRSASAAASMSPLDGARQGADRRFGDRFRDGYYGIEISRTRNGESGLDDIHAEAFEQAGHLDLFRGVQLAAGDLLSVAEGRVENIQFLAHTFVGRLFEVCVSEANILRNFQNKTASGGFLQGSLRLLSICNSMWLKSSFHVVRKVVFRTFLLCAITDRKQEGFRERV